MKILADRRQHACQGESYKTCFNGEIKYRLLILKTSQLENDINHKNEGKSKHLGYSKYEGVNFFSM
jgi:hypothetical protein